MNGLLVQLRFGSYDDIDIRHECFFQDHDLISDFFNDYLFYYYV